MNPIFMTDGYKLGHRNQYPKGTEAVYATWIPRSAKYYKEAEKEGVVFFGLQYFIKEYLVKRFNQEFFEGNIEKIVDQWERRMNTFLGPDNIVGSEHIRALHKLGYLPIQIHALPEGTVSPIGVPQLSIVNTHPDFFWLPNYLETLMSSVLFMPSTSATSSYLFKKELYRHMKKTVGKVNMADLGFNLHDFSMRGMPGLEASIISALGHLAVFNGTETLPALDAAEYYYNIDAEEELLAATVPATEHSVMSSSSSAEDERETFRRLLVDTYPKGFVSIVSDTFDYENVVTKIIPSLKEEILARDGRFVVRPDSGEPVDIICGDPKSDNEFYRKGTYETLWEIFGGTINDKGYKVLDNHIGIIYGDSITLARQKEIYRRLEEKGFAATNLVLGIGSFTFQGKTRDSLGFALKTSAVKIDGEWREVFKDPKTAGQDFSKKSLRGFASVEMDKGVMKVTDRLGVEALGQGLLKLVFNDGEFDQTTLTEIRNRINSKILGE